MHTVRVYAPIPTDFQGEPLEGFADLFGPLVAAIERSGSYALGDLKLPFTLRVLRGPEEAGVLPQHWASPRSERYGHVFLELTASTAPMAEFELPGFAQGYRGKQLPLYVANLVAEKLASRIATVAFASQLARPGVISVDAPLMFADEQLIGTADPISWVLGEAVEFANKFRWPPLNTIPLDDVLAWLDALPGFADGTPTGPVGRAVAALSFIVTNLASEHSPIDLAWAMLGLEALYGRGTEGLAQQLGDKTELLLGPRTEHKRSISRLYNYRSRFLHGSVDVPIAFRQFEIDSEDQDFQHEAYEHWGFACSVLIASLQELVRRGWHALEFATIIRPDPSGGATMPEITNYVTP